jgi:DNA/RNA-binding domain of Phe-tRNA-synthetase-like protein
VFVRRLGIDPDEPQQTVEAVALQRARRSPIESSGLPDDAVAITAAETGVPVLAFDADRLDGELWLREARPGERVGGADRDLPAGRPVLADNLRPVAAPFGPADPDLAVTPVTRRIVLAGLQVKGVPDIAVEEALWTAVEIIRSSQEARSR